MMIRNVEPKDIEAIASIYNHYITDTKISFEEEPVPTKEMQGRINKIISSSFPWLVAVDVEEVVGFAYAGQWNPRSAYKNSAEVTVYLSHLHTSKGWGTKLYKKLFEELERKSIHVVIAGIALPNPGSIALHEKFGLIKVAHYKEVGYKFGEWIDVGYWQKVLRGEGVMHR